MFGKWREKKAQRKEKKEKIPIHFKLRPSSVVVLDFVDYTVHSILRLDRRNPVTEQVEDYSSLLLYELQDGAKQSFLLCEATRNPTFYKVSLIDGVFKDQSVVPTSFDFRGVNREEVFRMYENGVYEPTEFGSTAFDESYYMHTWLYKSATSFFVHIWQNGKSFSFIGEEISRLDIQFLLNDSNNEEMHSN